MLLAAFAAAAQPLPPPDPAIGRTAWILSTIERSEWCPEGHVRLDLRTGRYELASRLSRPVCNRPGIERPVRAGRLAANRLSQVRAAYLQVLREGLKGSQCLDGRRPETVILSNAGTPILVVAGDARTASAPDDESCWSEAAVALQNLLDDMFRLAGPR